MADSPTTFLKLIAQMKIKSSNKNISEYPSPSSRVDQPSPVCFSSRPPPPPSPKQQAVEVFVLLYTRIQNVFRKKIFCLVVNHITWKPSGPLNTRSAKLSSNDSLQTEIHLSLSERQPRGRLFKKSHLIFMLFCAKVL